jgi:hypothetical protein
VFMLRINRHPGTILWQSPEVEDALLRMPALWVNGLGSTALCSCRPQQLMRMDAINIIYCQASSIHGRSCYLGNSNSDRHYFAKGTGYIHTYGWDRALGSYGILPRWAAERERDMAYRITALGIKTVFPEAIVLHTRIPDTDRSSFHDASSIPDLNGKPALPCMYVYSAACRWRLADLYYLSERQRTAVCGSGKARISWFRNICRTLGEFSARLHRAGGHDYSLSSHNVFCDGTRVDFEYAWFPDMPHPVEAAINTNPEVWRDKELDGLRSLAWEIAELLRLDVRLSTVTSWWERAYQQM